MPYVSVTEKGSITSPHGLAIHLYAARIWDIRHTIKGDFKPILSSAVASTQLIIGLFQLFSIQIPQDRQNGALIRLRGCAG